MRDVYVYLGPSLSGKEARAILDAEYLPPIRRGDLARLPETVRAVGIVDGEFYQSLSVSTKEIMRLLARGIKVFGAASVGALRAAETHRYGMVGVGEIFRLFRDGVLDGDDEVAIAYEPETYRNVSDALVSIRRGLELAVEAGVIGETERANLMERMKALYFPERSFRALDRMCPAVGEFLRRRGLPDMKAEDAREMLSVMRKACALTSEAEPVSAR